MESTRNKLVRVKISSIVLYDEVIKEYDLKLFEKLKRGIKKRGQLKNIIICESENGFECLEGSKIVKALKELEQDSVVAYNLGVLSEEDKKIIRIEIFKDFFLTNYVYIGKLLKEITQTVKLEEICNTIPFDVRQAKHLINMHEFDWDSFNQDKQNEGQSSLFDIFEEDNVSEIPIQETNIENSFDDKLSTEVISESKEISIDKEFDEKHLKSYEKATGELISEVQNENQVEVGFVSLNDLSQKVEESKGVVEDKAFNDLIDGVKPTEKPTFNINNQIKEYQALINKKGETIKVGDKVFLETPKKGLFEVEITKHSENWVYFIELSTGLKKDIDKKRFFENSKLSTPIELTETKEIKNDENQKQELQEFNIANVEEKKQLIKTDSFYYDYKNEVLVLTKNKDAILQNIPLIAKKILDTKWSQNCEPEKIDVRTQNENDQTTISNVIYISPYGVKISVILEEIGEVLMKIDFELN